MDFIQYLNKEKENFEFPDSNLLYFNIQAAALTTEPWGTTRLGDIRTNWTSSPQRLLASEGKAMEEVADVADRRGGEEPLPLGPHPPAQRRPGARAELVHHLPA